MMTQEKVYPIVEVGVMHDQPKAAQKIAQFDKTTGIRLVMDPVLNIQSHKVTTRCR